MSRSINILVGALGGDGGGVLCDWIIHAAQSQGLAVQATQIPGVAQRTGATTYYLEVMPAGWGGREHDGTWRLAPLCSAAAAP